MKECRVAQHEVLGLTTLSAERYVNNKLKEAGFDLKKRIEFYRDVITHDYMYTQED
jgi:hypothetical protein